MIIIFNKHQEYDASWCAEVVSVMRPNVLRNPTAIGPYVTRDMAISRFRHYLTEQMAQDTPQRREINRLRALHQKGQSIALLCCCSPLPCHADVIKSFVLNDSVLLNVS